MKHVVDRIEVSGDYLCVTVGGNVAYVAVTELPSGQAAQDALIEEKVDAMIAAISQTVPVTRTRAAAIVTRLKPPAKPE